MGPVGPGYTGAFMAALNLAVSSICCSITSDMVSFTLLLTFMTSSRSAAFSRPGRVPSTYCSFSPWVLRIWLRLSSSAAMEEIIPLMLPSRVSGGSI
jgi:hypothetical protein